MTHICPEHEGQPILFICLEEKCKERRLCCIKCVDQYHSKHNLVSISKFVSEMKKLQINRDNPHKLKIMKQLDKTKDQLMEKLQVFKNKILGQIGQCQTKVQSYYSKLYHSLAVPDHQYMQQQLFNHFDSAQISEIIKHMKQIEQIELGNYNQTQALLYVYRSHIQQKINESGVAIQTTIKSLEESIGSLTLTKPPAFKQQFSLDKKQACLNVSDTLKSVLRKSGNGGYPMCLVSSPFNPLQNKVTFLIEKMGVAQPSICLGVCLGSIVKTNGYGNCYGSGKGIYAIDQNYPYNTGGTTLACWNHHDTNFNQTNVGNSDLVGWTFKQGDKVCLQLDYYNSVVAFIKNPQSNNDSEDIEIYQMPVRLDLGPIFAFVSMQQTNDQVSIVHQQIVIDYF